MNGRGGFPAPVETGFELPGGDTQPFIHVMWDEQTIDGYTVVEPDEGTATPGAGATTATGTPTDSETDAPTDGNG